MVRPSVLKGFRNSLKVQVASFHVWGPLFFAGCSLLAQTPGSADDHTSPVVRGRPSSNLISETQSTIRGPDVGEATVDYFAVQVVDGRNPGNTDQTFRTFFHIANVSQNTAEVSVELTRDDGQAMNVVRPGGLPPGGGGIANRESFSIPPNGSNGFVTIHGPFLQIGWGVIRSSQPVGVTVTTEFIVSRTSEVLSAVVHEAKTLLRERAFHSTSAVGRPALGLLNSSEELAAVTISLYKLGGELVDERLLTLAPKQKVAKFVTESPYFPDLDFPGALVVRVTSNVAIASLPIRVNGIHWDTLPEFPRP